MAQFEVFFFQLTHHTRIFFDFQNKIRFTITLGVTTVVLKMLTELLNRAVIGKEVGKFIFDTTFIKISSILSAFFEIQSIIDPEFHIRNQNRVTKRSN